MAEDRLERLGRVRLHARRQQSYRRAMWTLAVTSVLAAVLVVVVLPLGTGAVLLAAAPVPLVGAVLVFRERARQRPLEGDDGASRQVQGEIAAGLEAIGGIQALDAHVLSADGVLGDAVAAFVAQQKLTTGQHDVFLRLASDGFEGSVGELIAVSRGLG